MVMLMMMMLMIISIQRSVDLVGFFFSPFLPFLCNPWGCDRPLVFLHYMILPGSMVPFLAFLLYLAAIITRDILVSPPEPIQEDFHPLGHFSKPIPASSISALLFLLPLSISKTWEFQ